MGGSKIEVITSGRRNSLGRLDEVRQYSLTVSAINGTELVFKILYLVSFDPYLIITC